MSVLKTLLKNYEAQMAPPWNAAVSAHQRVYFLVYDPKEERRVRCYISEFELATKKLGLSWQLLDVTHYFADWLMQNKYHEAYFENPADLEIALDGFTGFFVEQVQERLASADANTVFSLLGVGTLFGLSRVSSAIAKLAPSVRGRLLVFFPGQFDRNNYRLFDARDGWNYHAIPITSLLAGIIWSSTLSFEKTLISTHVRDDTCGEV